DRRQQGLRIARISTVSFFIETQLRLQIASIVEAGAEVIVVASEKKLSHTIPGVRYVSIEIPRKISFYKDFIALLKLWIFFRRSNLNVVRSTTTKAGLLSSIPAKLARVPIRLHT